MTIFLLERRENDALASAQGCGDEVIISCVSIDNLPFARYDALFYAFDICMDIADVPLSAYDVKAMRSSTQPDVRSRVPIVRVM